MPAISGSCTGADSWAALADKFAARAQAKIIAHRNAVISALTDHVAKLTPVWEGDTLQNWKWSVGSPNLTHREPVGGIDPGATNSMPLGSEPRRPMNTPPIFESLAAVLAYDGLDSIYLTNASEGAVPLEYGLWPGGPGQVSRSPNGILRLALKQIRGNLR
jgi:hypothetical protein